MCTKVFVIYLIGVHIGTWLDYLAYKSNKAVARVVAHVA
jgi:hypothetical protein